MTNAQWQRVMDVNLLGPFLLCKHLGAQMLSRAAMQLSGEVQRRAMALATVLEPLLIVAMGGVVMLIVLAVLLPIIQMNAWVK